MQYSFWARRGNNWLSHLFTEYTRDNTQVSGEKSLANTGLYYMRCKGLNELFTKSQLKEDNGNRCEECQMIDAGGCNNEES